jgi:nitric-oxide synthase
LSTYLVWENQENTRTLMNGYQSEYLRTLQEKAEKFYLDYYAEQDLGCPRQRLRQVFEEIEATGTYEQSFKELEYGAKVAWRNSNRCIGRLYWKTLKVRDQRHLQEEAQIFESIVEHLDFATNAGKIRSTISIYKVDNPLREQSVRIWNAKLIHYAGYEQNGKCIGDPHEIEFTKVCQELGWRGAGTAFDVLPLVIQIDGRAPKWFELPKTSVREVQITHPDLLWFEELNLKWYAVPLITDMVLEIGGLHYSCAPFNGWYMVNEIASRNFGDEQRYNLLPIIAERMQLDTSSAHSLWKDRAMLELNLAVLHSFNQQGISMVDHHTASDQFMSFVAVEQKAGREVHADWAWIVPPMSGSSTQVFHQQWPNKVLTPNFFYNTPVWKKGQADDPVTACPFHIKTERKKQSLTLEIQV